MRKVTQTRTGSDGNCMAACLATLTGKLITAFEYVNDEHWMRNLNEVLAPMGLCYVEFPLDTAFSWCGECAMIGIGTSPRGLMHAVIVKHVVMDKRHRWEWLHDPHPDGGWVELEAIGLLIPTWKTTKHCV